MAVDSTRDAVSWTQRRIARPDGAFTLALAGGGMTTELRVLDDGAWVSVDNERRVPTSDIWRFAATDFCSCPIAFVLLEAFTRVGVADREVVVDGVGRCVDCGEKHTFDGLGVGRVLDDEFRPYPPDAVRARSEPVV